jgi:hypothetical protein
MMRSMSMPLSLGKEMHRSICAIFMPNNASFYQDRRRINIAKTLKIKNCIFLLQGGPGGGEGGLSPSARQSAVAYRWRQHFRRSANERRCAIRPLVAQRRVRAHPGVCRQQRRPFCAVLCYKPMILPRQAPEKGKSPKQRVIMRFLAARWALRAPTVPWCLRTYSSRSTRRRNHSTRIASRCVCASTHSHESMEMRGK